MIIDAILKINPNAKVCVTDTGDINTSTIEWLDGTTPLSNEDIVVKIAELPTKEQQFEQLKADQASGNQKLLDLGLSQAEATALTGYTPPTEV